MTSKPTRSEPELPSFPSPATRGTIRRRLLVWFDIHRRDLPWRKTRDPYPIWVSEVMLQQTQVATVVRYFEPFLRSFPTVAALAAADEQDVLRHWQGLGYYRRARDLHRAARLLVEEHGNQFPDDPDALGRIPGMGRYTVGALLSQAYERRLPILEANSRRVLCRLFGVRADPTTAPAQAWLWQVAELLLPRRRVGDFNQAVMELGALVCTPTAPDCPHCPLAAVCLARRQAMQTEIPLRPARKAPIEVAEVAVAVRRQGRLLLVQGPAGGRWAGLWEFPRAPVTAKETHEAVALRWLHERVGLRVRLGGEVATVKHGVTHHRITLVCLEGQHRSGEFRPGHYPQAEWVEPGRVDNFPVSSPQRRLSNALASGQQASLF